MGCVMTLRMGRCMASWMGWAMDRLQCVWKYHVGGLCHGWLVQYSLVALCWYAQERSHPLFWPCLLELSAENHAINGLCENTTRQVLLNSTGSDEHDLFATWKWGFTFTRNLHAGLAHYFSATFRSWYSVAGSDDRTLVFESRFESGNLRRAIQASARNCLCAGKTAWMMQCTTPHSSSPNAACPVVNGACGSWKDFDCKNVFLKPADRPSRQLVLSLPYPGIAFSSAWAMNANTCVLLLLEHAQW